MNIEIVVIMTYLSRTREPRDTAEIIQYLTHLYSIPFYSKVGPYRLKP